MSTSSDSSNSEVGVPIIVHADIEVVPQMRPEEAHQAITSFSDDRIETSRTPINLPKLGIEISSTSYKTFRDRIAKRPAPTHMRPISSTRDESAIREDIRTPIPSIFSRQAKGEPPKKRRLLASKELAGPVKPTPISKLSRAVNLKTPDMKRARAPLTKVRPIEYGTGLKDFLKTLVDENPLVTRAKRAKKLQKPLGDEERIIAGIEMCTKIERSIDRFIARLD